MATDPKDRLLGDTEKEVDGGGGVFETVTVTLAEVAVFPAASRATAVRVCAALVAVVVSHERAYGATITSAPRLAPSSLNCTPTTPTLSEALADTVTEEPDTVALLAGAEMETVGKVVSPGAESLSAMMTVALLGEPMV